MREFVLVMVVRGADNGRPVSDLCPSWERHFCSKLVCSMVVVGVYALLQSKRPLERRVWRGGPGGDEQNVHLRFLSACGGHESDLRGKRAKKRPGSQGSGEGRSMWGSALNADARHRPDRSNPNPRPSQVRMASSTTLNTGRTVAASPKGRSRAPSEAAGRIVCAPAPSRTNHARADSRSAPAMRPPVKPKPPGSPASRILFTPSQKPHNPHVCPQP